jgi:hypothetical protein
MMATHLDSQVPHHFPASQFQAPITMLMQIFVPLWNKPRRQQRGPRGGPRIMPVTPETGAGYFHWEIESHEHLGESR